MDEQNMDATTEVDAAEVVMPVGHAPHHSSSADEADVAEPDESLDMTDESVVGADEAAPAEEEAA